MTDKATKIIIIVLIIAVILPTIVVSIVSLVIAKNHENTPCDGAMMPLPIWLRVYGGCGLAMSIALILAVVLLFCDNPAGLYMYAVVYILMAVFMFAWNIVGAVALFRDSNNCLKTDNPLWAMTLAVLIIQWIGMIVTCCKAKKRRDDTN